MGIGGLNTGSDLLFLVHLQFTQLKGTCVAGSQRLPGVMLATSPVCHGYGNWYALTHISQMSPCGPGWNHWLWFVYDCFHSRGTFPLRFLRHVSTRYLLTITKLELVVLLFRWSTTPTAIERTVTCVNKLSTMKTLPQTAWIKRYSRSCQKFVHCQSRRLIISCSMTSHVDLRRCVGLNQQLCCLFEIPPVSCLNIHLQTSFVTVILNVHGLSSIHGVQWRHYYYYCIATPFCWYKKHCNYVGIRLYGNLGNRWRMFLGYFYSSSKQAWQNSRCSIRLHCAIFTYNMASQSVMLTMTGPTRTRTRTRIRATRTRTRPAK